MGDRPVWRNDIERNAWIEKNCRVCFQPDEARARLSKTHGCPHLIQSLLGRLPTPWKRRRLAPIGETYRCEAFIDKPPTVRRKSAPADTAPMFEPPTADRNLVPVEGWPDFRADERKQKGGDHQ